MDPRLRSRLRRTLEEKWLPKWASSGLCAGRDTADWFADDVADSPNPTFPSRVSRSMKTCHACPVRRPCLEYAFEMERSVDVQRWWSGEPVEERRRFGVYGGVPGRIREHLADDPDRIEKCEEWLEAEAVARRWPTALPPNGRSTKRTA